MKTQRSPEYAGAGVWRRRWALLTGAGALSVTAIDALLLERRKNFFSGGFLSVDHLIGVGDTSIFLAASLLSDAATVGLLAAFGLVLFNQRDMSLRGRLCAALSIGVVPLLAADFIFYQLFAYLGDAFDLSLMFDLTGRQPTEIFAVASAHLIFPGAVLAGAGAAVVVLVWMLNRSAASGGVAAPSLRSAHLMRWSAALFVVGLTVTTILRASSDVMDNGLRRKPAGKALGTLSRWLTDWDRDGFGIPGRTADPDPLDSRVTPYALEIPGNGADENGVAGDLPVFESAYREGARIPSPWVRTPDVVFIVLESFRADTIGAMFSGQPVTPFLDRLAAGGVAAKSAFSHNGYTAQSRYHLLSGTLAIRGKTTLIDDFKANGYEVAYFSGQDESFGGPEQDVGFERADVKYDARVEPHRRYSTFTTAGSLAVPYTVVLERVRAFLQSRASTRPLFLYVNFHDTHFPYRHASIRPLINDVVLRRPEIAPRNAAALRAMYLNTAANVDRAVQAVIDSTNRGKATMPAVIVTADHGESLFDEGFLGHGYALNDVQTQVPLIVRNLPLIIEEPFGHAELRDALRAALARRETAAPSVHVNPSKRAFQYLGSIDSPRQIGHATMAGRTLYDFRDRRVKIGNGPWRLPANLDTRERGAFLELVWQWERMTLARREAEQYPR